METKAKEWPNDRGGIGRVGVFGHVYSGPNRRRVGNGFARHQYSGYGPTNRHAMPGFFGPSRRRTFEKSKLKKPKCRRRCLKWSRVAVEESLVQVGHNRGGLRRVVGRRCLSWTSCAKIGIRAAPAAPAAVGALTGVTDGLRTRTVAKENATAGQVRHEEAQLRRVPSIEKMSSRLNSVEREVVRGAHKLRRLTRSRGHHRRHQVHQDLLDAEVRRLPQHEHRSDAVQASDALRDFDAVKPFSKESADLPGGHFHKPTLSWLMPRAPATEAIEDVGDVLVDRRVDRMLRRARREWHSIDVDAVAAETDMGDTHSAMEKLLPAPSQIEGQPGVVISQRRSGEFNVQELHEGGESTTEEIQAEPSSPLAHFKANSMKAEVDTLKGITDEERKAKSQADRAAAPLRKLDASLKASAVGVSMGAIRHKMGQVSSKGATALHTATHARVKAESTEIATKHVAEDAQKEEAFFKQQAASAMQAQDAVAKAKATVREVKQLKRLKKAQAELGAELEQLED